MTGMQFAQVYAGHKLKIPADCLPEKALEYRGFYPLRGRVIGYMKHNTDRVVLELEETYEGCWPLYEGVQLVVMNNNKNFYNPKNPHVISVNYKKLTPPMNLDDIKAQRKKEQEEADKIVIPPAYPMFCKVCYRPARVYSGKTMCSNKTCNTRRKVLSTLAIKRIKTRPLKCQYKYKGKLCQQPIVYTAGRGIDDKHVLYCSVDHETYIADAELKHGDLIAYTKAGHDFSDRIWNGQTWEPY